MKFFLKFIGTILGIAIVGVLTWAVLYFTVPKVKDWTNDNVFKHEQSKGDENTKKLKEENKNLKTQLEEITSSRNNISSELNNVKNDLDTKETALKTATEEKGQLESKVQELIYQRTEVENKLNNSKVVNNALTLENKQLKQAKTDIELELEKVRAQLQTKETQITTLNSQIAQLEADKASLASQLENKNQQIQQLQSQIAETFAISTADVLSMGYTIHSIARTNKYVYVDIEDGSMPDTDPYMGVFQIANNTLKRVGRIIRRSAYLQMENGTEVIIGTSGILIIDTNGNATYKKYTNYMDFSTYENYLKLFVSGNKLLCFAEDNCFVYDTQTFAQTTFTLNTITNEHIIKISNNYFLRFSCSQGDELYKFSVDTLTETSMNNAEGLYEFRVNLGNNKILLSDGVGSGYIYNLETMTVECDISDFVDCKANHFFGATVYSVGGTSNYYIVSFAGLYYCSSDDDSFTKILNHRGTIYEASNGDIFCAMLSTGVNNSSKGIYKLDGSTATKIYDNGFSYDTVTEDETGCVFSSKLNPTQASVRYDYATGTCTEVE